MKFYKRRTNDLEEIVNRYKSQMGELAGYTSATSQSEADVSDRRTTADGRVVYTRGSSYRLGHFCQSAMCAISIVDLLSLCF
jgi:hypothetical protein